MPQAEHRGCGALYWLRALSELRVPGSQWDRASVARLWPHLAYSLHAKNTAKLWNYSVILFVVPEPFSGREFTILVKKYFVTLLAD